MARRLDPELQRIIENASRDVQSDPFHNSIAYHDFALNPPEGNLNHRQSVDATGLITTAFPPAHAVLDKFDRNMWRADNAFMQFDSKNDLPRLTLSTIIPSKSLHSTKTIPPFIYGRQISQQEPMDDRVYTSALRPYALSERQKPTRVAPHEPTTTFHGIDGTSRLGLVGQGPTTPLNLASYEYNAPARTITTPSSGHLSSSPSTRISLRRIGNRPTALTQSIVSHSDFEGEPTSITPLQWQKLSIQVTATTPLKFPRQPPIVHGIHLVSPHELPDRFRQVFPYKLFNAVQSKCFSTIYKSNDNFVVAAPTGSGKTAILELAICKLVQDFGLEQFKIVYQAPTKSLCSERVRDWEKKFSHLNLSCAELTGDTDSAEMRKVGNAAIIVTTPEKWDSITRKWKDHIKLLELVKLVLIDEVHILKDPRGATLEAVVSRMKSIGTMVRFIALSATVPNSEDIATWLGRDHTNGHLPAHRETFGEEFRPVKLQKHVYGFSANINDFAFDSLLDTKLPGLIEKHTAGKPMMVFCVTRKICENTALKLAQWWSGQRITERPWPIPQKIITVGNHELRGLVGCGVAFHHAGLDAQDRAAVENGFLRDGLSVICCTSTLAVGVNLPCHLVVIKNTVCYKDTGLSEYSDLEVMQMLGRAGRPQFDHNATAVIMTRAEKADHYDSMISGQDILESTLHLNLIEHLNSEIGLGTVHDVYSAKRWLAGTFLSVRLRKNPKYYKFSCDTGSQDADERLEAVCERDIELLKSTKLITDDQRFICTEYGHAMTKYMVQFETMKLLLSIPKNAKMMQILHIVSQSSEFKDLRVKPNERASFREFNKSPFIKSPIKGNINAFAHKVSLIIQIHLGGVDLPMDKEFNIIKRQFQSEKAIIFERILHLIRCVVECKAYECDGIATCNALELLRSIAAGYWESSTLQLRQLPTIGPAAVRKLVQSDIKTVTQLAAMDSAAIERMMSRNPPFGKKIIDVLATFPQLTLEVAIKKKFIKALQPVKVQLMAQVGYKNTKLPVWNRRVPIVTFTATTSNGNLAHIWRGPLKRLEKKFEVPFTCELLEPTDIIICQLACEEVVGTIQMVELRPEIPASAFLPLKSMTSPAKTVPNALPAKDTTSAERETQIPAEVEILVGGEHGRLGSDYGVGSDFDDFVNIDDIEKFDGGDLEPGVVVAVSEPVRMANGRWRCNHKCRDTQGNYLNKNGAPCKHLCCREGLEKPRKLQQKKVTESKNPTRGQRSKVTEKNHFKVQKKPSKYAPKLKLKLVEPEVSFYNLEEIDLVDERLEVESTCESPKNPSIPAEGNLDFEQVPQFSCQSGSQHNLALIGYSDRNDKDSQEFLLSSALLDSKYRLNFDWKQDSEALCQESSSNEFKSPAITQSAPSMAESVENTPFDFDAFQALEAAAPVLNLSPNRKRPAHSIEAEPEVKYRRLAMDREMLRFERSGELQVDATPEMGAKKPLPAWVAEFDQDIIAFFGDSVEYKE